MLRYTVDLLSVKRAVANVPSHLQDNLHNEAIIKKIAYLQGYFTAIEATSPHGITVIKQDDKVTQVIIDYTEIPYYQTGNNYKAVRAALDILLCDKTIICYCITTTIDLI